MGTAGYGGRGFKERARVSDERPAAPAGFKQALSPGPCGSPTLSCAQCSTSQQDNQPIHLRQPGSTPSSVSKCQCLAGFLDSVALLTRAQYMTNIHAARSRSQSRSRVSDRPGVWVKARGPYPLPCPGVAGRQEERVPVLAPPLSPRRTDVGLQVFEYKRSGGMCPLKTAVWVRSG